MIFGGGFPLGPWWFYAFLLVGLVVAGTTGILLGLPVLRLRGDYLAIVTLGFGEVIRVLANNLDKPINFTNGPKGITPIGRPPAVLGLSYGEFFYFLVLLIVVVVVIVNRRLEDSHIGRAWEAMREDELAAQAMGVPLVRMKLLAFATGASFAGIMGVVFSAKQVFINPESFTFLESIGVLAMVILGGMGSIRGAVLGAAVVTVLNLQVLKGFSLWLNELKNDGVTVFGFALADLPTQFEPAKYERMIFGIILILMMIFRPQGILPARRRQRELAEQPGTNNIQPSEAAAHDRALRGARDHEALRRPHRGHRVDFALDSGIASIIGPNGAGKTTLFNVFTGLYAPDEGAVTFQGHPLVGLRPDQITGARHLPDVPEHPALRQHDGLENVLVGMHARIPLKLWDVLARGPASPAWSPGTGGAGGAARAVGLRASANEVAKNLPYGDQRRLEIARALASEPTLLLLDEPTAGMTQGEATGSWRSCAGSSASCGSPSSSSSTTCAW